MKKHIGYFSAFILIVIIVICIFPGENKYEEKMVGRYVMFDYNLNDTQLATRVPSLTLYKNLHFFYTCGDMEQRGVWEANETREEQYIKFVFDDDSHDIFYRTIEGEICGDSSKLIYMNGVPSQFKSKNINNAGIIKFIRIGK